MPHPTETTSGDEKEIKLYYQLFFAEENISALPKENWKVLAKDSDIPFADDIFEDLQNRNLSEKAIQQINTAIEKEKLYFKVYRDDEDIIPKNAFLLEQIRILPNQGLLGLDEKLQTKISEWTPSFVSSAIDTISTWAWNNLPALKTNNMSKTEIFSVESEEDYFSADELDEELEETISQNKSQEPEIKDTEPSSTTENKHPASFFQKAVNTAWQLSSYILHIWTRH
jgi:hypothetical protein